MKGKVLLWWHWSIIAAVIFAVVFAITVSFGAKPLPTGITAIVGWALITLGEWATHRST